ncbi:hypothetical protein [Catenovulum sp. 2E275]|uniref:hypothetical protein n=1 Tax=Catenovulum sp. 2E275 TaxID=2980497 RepID=UPI00292A5449|nr:hypothetical protein [Catenovulum sp. 2E275]
MLWDDDVLAWHIAASPNPEFIRIAFEPKAARWAAERGSMEAILNIEKASLTYLGVLKHTLSQVLQ